MIERDRIEYLVAKEGSAVAFARKIGTTEASVSKLRSGVFHIGRFAVRIAEAYPSLNCRWLLTGEGEPFIDEPSQSEVSMRLSRIEKKLGVKP